MKTGYRDELYPGHTKDSYNHLGHDLRFLPFIYLFAPPHTPMSTCTHAPEDRGMFAYCARWRQVLSTEKATSKGGCRAEQARQTAAPLQSWLLPNQGLRDTERASHNL